ncbi:uncharacterized protein LOC143150318 [Ptiloglossa arizonensis]|uniref:uncharacterized protein LOC143150318 n=1 Tax=Ptiloglossa arizonensis TaxID=3350558 RepID=UPI003F9FD7D9
MKRNGQAYTLRVRADFEKIDTFRNLSRFLGSRNSIPDASIKWNSNPVEGAIREHPLVLLCNQLSNSTRNRGKNYENRTTFGTCHRNPTLQSTCNSRWQFVAKVATIGRVMHRWQGVDQKARGNTRIV